TLGTDAKNVVKCQEFCGKSPVSVQTNHQVFADKTPCKVTPLNWNKCRNLEIAKMRKRPKNKGFLRVVAVLVTSRGWPRTRRSLPIDSGAGCSRCRCVDCCRNSPRERSPQA